MNISRALLDQAADRGVIDKHQACALWQFFSAQTAHTPSFKVTHILYYLGGLIAIGAMTLFMTLGWKSFGGMGLFLIALAYAACGLWLTHHFLNRLNLPIPAGITAAFVVALTPLAVYGLQMALGYWNDDPPYRAYHTLIDGRWLIMECATLAVGASLLWRYRLPFMVMPVAVTLWYMSMDLALMLAQQNDGSWTLRQQVSLWFGLSMVALALWVDTRSRPERDFPFWLYLFGVLAFWGALSSMRSDSELNKFFYLCINLLMIALGAVLVRRVFVIFGALGTAGYIGHLAYAVFKDSLLFPFVLTLIGLGVVYLGVLWQRNEAEISNRLRSHLPEFLGHR